MNKEQKPSPLLLSLFKNPRLTGAVASSSRGLALLMAKQAQGAEQIIELGAGTGAITKVLLEQYPEKIITSVEYQEQLVKGLRQSFPHLDIRHATAKSVLDTLPQGDKRIAIVSALPFRSLPLVVKDETVESIFALFKRCPMCKLIQFTYRSGPPFDIPKNEENNFQWQLIDRAWLNIPPATVWVLHHIESQ